MNMISTGTFLSEMEASGKQDRLVNKLVSAWEQKNSKTARAGGISLMALSLAACGSSDDSGDAVSYSQEQLEAAKLEAASAVDITTDNAGLIEAAVSAVDITSDNAAVIKAAVDAVDLSTDNAAATTLALRDAATGLGVEGTTNMTTAELITAIKTANDGVVKSAAVDSVDITTDNAALIKAAVDAVDITTDNAALIQAAVDAVDITTDNAALIQAAIDAVDLTSDNAAAFNVSLRNAAAELDVTGTSVMTTAELITAIKTANDVAVTNAGVASVDTSADDAAAINAAVLALGISGVSTLAQFAAAYDTLANPTVTNFVLTNAANTSTGGADNFTGTAGADTFMATADAALDNGDVIVGGDGADTLTARYAVAADTTINTSVTGVETIIIDTDEGAAADHELNFNGGQSGLTELRIRDAVATDAAGTDDINITSLALTTAVSIERGDGIFDVEFAYAGATGASDTVTLKTLAASVETVTMAAVETINIEATSGTSGIATFTTTAATVVNITGSGALTITNIDDVTTTINAATATGHLTVEGIGAVTSIVTGGDGNDTMDFAGNLTNLDTFNGGDGTDRVVVNTNETTALPLVTLVEEIEIEAANQANGTTLTISGTAVTSANHFVSDVTVGADNADVTVAFTNMDDGDSISIVSGGADSTTVADGLAVTGTLTTDTSADDVTVTLVGLGAVSANATNDTGVALLTLASHETINVVSNNNATGSVTTNGMESLDASSATSLVITGAAAYDLDAITNTTALTAVNASGSSGAITIDGLDASALTLTAGGGNLVASLAGLNNADTIVGGVGTADIVTGLATTGLTATTGVLNVTNVETVILQATGANTVSGASLSGVNTLAISGATPGTQTITGLAAGVNVQLGEATGAGAAFDNGDIISIALADATGSSDAMTINVENDAAGTDANIDMTGVETTTFAVSGDTNNMTVDLAGVTSPTMLVNGGAAGAVLTMGTLNAATTSLDVSGYDGEVTVTGASAGAFTLIASGAAAADDYTLGAGGDTATIGSTGAVDADIDMGTGTDTLNLTLATGFINSREIDGVENLNLIIGAGVDINIGANGTNAADANGIAEATTVTITGGNELSTLEVGDSAAVAADTIDAAVDINATGFNGNVFLEFTTDILTATTDVDAGSLTTDTVQALFDTAATDIVVPFTGVETFVADLNSGNTAANEQYNFDVDTATGLTSLRVASSNGENTLLDVDDYVSTVTVQLGSLVSGTSKAYDSSSEVDINLLSATGTSDVANVLLFDTDDAAGTIDIDAAGVETLNVSVTSTATEDHQIDLAGVTATTGSNVTVNLTGGDTGELVTIANTSATTNVLNATGFDSNITMTDRGSSTMTITGGDGTDSLRMENANDVINGGAGTDTLVVVQNAIIGGFLADLSSTTDQMSTYNGASNSSVQIGFENIDLSGVTGTNGADITAQSGATTTTSITGTNNADQITLGTGTDTVIYDATAAGSDTITSFTTGTDNLDVAAAARADFDTAGANIVATTGFVTLGLAGDAVTGAHTAAKAITELAAFDAQITASDLFFFTVDNGTDTALFFFDDSAAGGGNADATADAGEAIFIATLSGVGDALLGGAGDVII
jgi:hypothetical protein